MDAEAGISETEREEIRSRIEEVATENRIPVDAGHFSMKSARRGVLFPLIVNGIAVIGTLAVVLLVSQVFGADARELRNEAARYASVEGRLIRELREESQQILLAKEREIEVVRRQLQELEGEQQELEESIEQRLAAREAELRERLEAEIEAERTRLIAEGLDNQEIERLMEQFEQEREAYYEQQLEQYRAELEAERVALQEEIDQLRAEYNTRLQELEAEREEIIAEYREREDDLRVQLEQRTAILERIREETEVDLEAAQRELARLEREEQRVQAVEDQIVGQIDRIRDALLQENADAAIGRIDALLAYLQEASVAAIAENSDRRDVDIFLLNQLRARLSEEVESEERSLTEELRLLGQIRDLSQAAQGGEATTETLAVFDELVRTIPEVAVAHRALLDDAVETAVDTLREEDRAEVEVNIGAAADAVAAGEYGRALSRYEAALAATPAVAPDLSRMVTDMLLLGYSLAQYTRDGEPTSGQEQISTRAQIDLDAERSAFLEQIEAAVTARETQLRDEMESIRESMNAELDAAIAQKEAELQTTVAELDAEIAALEAERDALHDSGSEAEQLLRERNAELAQAQQALAATQAELDQALASLEDQNSGLIASLESEIATLEEAVEAAERQRERALSVAEEQRAADLAEAEQQRIAQLDTLAEAARTERSQLLDRINQLVGFQDQVEAARQAYAEYAAAEQQARSENPGSAANAARLELTRFLQDQAVQSLFATGGGLATRINSLFREFETGFASSALEDAAVRIQDIADQESIDASRRLLAIEIEDAAGNEELVRILEAVDSLLAQAQG